MLIPYVVIVNGPGEIPFILIRIITVTAVLLIVYYVGGIMAGDVKLLGLISGYLCGTDVIKYIILVFYFAAFIGIVKVLMNLIIDRETPKKITIKFSCPIFLAYHKAGNTGRFSDSGRIYRSTCRRRNDCNCRWN